MGDFPASYVSHNQMVIIFLFPGRAAWASDGATLATGHQTQWVCGGQGAVADSTRGDPFWVDESGDFFGLIMNFKHNMKMSGPIQSQKTWTLYEHILCVKHLGVDSPWPQRGQRGWPMETQLEDTRSIIFGNQPPIHKIEQMVMITRVTMFF